ncbi:MAG: hypothetical protein ACYDDG_09240 [Casimicrobiaceae bacterium]
MTVAYADGGGAATAGGELPLGAAAVQPTPSTAVTQVVAGIGAEPQHGCRSATTTAPAAMASYPRPDCPTGISRAMTELHSWPAIAT